jgi:6-phosphogluconolactonase
MPSTLRAGKSRCSTAKGATPAHLTVDPTGRHLVVANYVGGNFVVLPIETDGRLGPVTGEIMDAGRGPNEQRQTAPHPHMVTFDPAGRFVAAQTPRSTSSATGRQRPDWGKLMAPIKQFQRLA